MSSRRGCALRVNGFWPVEARIVARRQKWLFLFFATEMSARRTEHGQMKPDIHFRSEDREQEDTEDAGGARDNPDSHHSYTLVCDARHWSFTTFAASPLW